MWLRVWERARGPADNPWLEGEQDACAVSCRRAHTGPREDGLLPKRPPVYGVGIEAARASCGGHCCGSGMQLPP